MIAQQDSENCFKKRKEIVKKFWGYFDRSDFESAGRLMKKDATVIWPNTKEIFKGADKFIRTNKNYPGKWRVKVEKIFPSGSIAISIVKVYLENSCQSFYAVSFFEFSGGKIKKIEEYWGDVSDPPEWRTKSGLAERY